MKKHHASPIPLLALLAVWPLFGPAPAEATLEATVQTKYGNHVFSLDRETDSECVNRDELESLGLLNQISSASLTARADFINNFPVGEDGLAYFFSEEDCRGPFFRLPARTPGPDGNPFRPVTNKEPALFMFYKNIRSIMIKRVAPPYFVTARQLSAVIDWRDQVEKKLDDLQRQMGDPIVVETSRGTFSGSGVPVGVLTELDMIDRPDPQDPGDVVIAPTGFELAIQARVVGTITIETEPEDDPWEGPRKKSSSSGNLSDLPLVTLPDVEYHGGGSSRQTEIPVDTLLWLPYHVDLSWAQGSARCEVSTDAGAAADRNPDLLVPGLAAVLAASYEQLVQDSIDDEIREQLGDYEVVLARTLTTPARTLAPQMPLLLETGHASAAMSILEPIGANYDTENSVISIVFFEDPASTDNP